MNGVAWFLMAGTFIVFAEMQYHLIMYQSYGGYSKLDVTPYWTQADAMTMLTAQGEVGRNAYRDLYTGLKLGGDFVYPLFYGSFLVSVLHQYGSSFWMLPVLIVALDFTGK